MPGRMTTAGREVSGVEFAGGPLVPPCLDHLLAAVPEAGAPANGPGFRRGSDAQIGSASPGIFPSITFSVQRAPSHHR